MNNASHILATLVSCLRENPSLASFPPNNSYFLIIPTPSSRLSNCTLSCSQYRTNCRLHANWSWCAAKRSDSNLSVNRSVISSSARKPGLRDGLMDFPGRWWSLMESDIRDRRCSILGAFKYLLKFCENKPDTMYRNSSNRKKHRHSNSKIRCALDNNSD